MTLGSPCIPRCLCLQSVGLILRTTYFPFNVFILLSGWICWHGVLTKLVFSRFSNALKISAYRIVWRCK